MDVIFETSKGRQFTIEVGFFDTVLEIKEKIHKYEGFPVTEQTLVFNGQVMSDEGDTELYEVLEGSRIRLTIKTTTEEPPPPPPSVKSESSSEPPAPSTSVKLVQLPINISLSKRRFSLECDVTETVGRLKERIQSNEGIPANRFVLYIGANELQENRSLGDYGVSDHSEVNVVIRQPYPIGGGGGGVGTTTTTTAMAMTTTSTKKMKVMVLPKCGTKKIAVEVNPMDNVGELRKELQRVINGGGQMNLNLPAGEGYFFIYKQNVMDDERTFRWHDVKHGDTIEIFNGSVTGGS